MRLFDFKELRKKFDRDTWRRVLLLYLFLSLGFCLLVGMGIIAFVQQALLLGIADFITASIIFTLLFYLHKTGDEPTASRLGMAGLGFFFCALFYIGGVHATAFMWLYTFPLLSLYLLGLRQGVVASLLLFIFCVGFLTVDLSSDLFRLYTKDFAIRFIPSYLVVCTLAFLVEKNRFENWQAMFEKQQLLAETIRELQNKEAELEESRNTLEQRVVQRTTELEQANKQLRVEIEERARLAAELLRAQKMETLGRLAGGVAHDLNNVLTGIVSYPDMLLLDLPPDDPLRGPLQSIHRAGLRAAAIVQDLLALARRAITIKERVCINEVITNYLQSPEFLTLQRQYPQVHVIVDLAADVAPILGSPVHLEKVIMNLLVNSFEAMTEDGQIVIATENQNISAPMRRIEITKPGRYVVLTVKDNGVGIPEDHLNLIFEPFFSSKDMGHSGTGLGMTVVLGTVKDLDGHLDVTSTPGKGTIITIYLPALEDEVTVQEEPSQVVQRGHGETLLLVDDDQEHRILGRRMLTLLGYAVETAANGEEALRFLDHHEFDLILLDMIMGSGLDGLDTYQRILAIRPEQRVLIVSGYAETERTQLAMELGACGYVQKPYTLRSLSFAIYRELTMH